MVFISGCRIACGPTKDDDPSGVAAKGHVNLNYRGRIVKMKYRILRMYHGLYKVEVRRWYWPFWHNPHGVFQKVYRTKDAAIRDLMRKETKHES